MTNGTPSSGGVSLNCANPLRMRHSGRTRPLVHRRRPRSTKRLDHRRGRLGLRYRLRRPRPCPGQRRERKRPRPGYRGVFQHRRPGVQVHTLGAVAKFAAGGKPTAEEGPWNARDELRQCVCRSCGDGSQGSAHDKDVPRGRITRWSVVDHRLCHCIAHGIDMTHGFEPAEACGRQRLLATLPI